MDILKVFIATGTGKEYNFLRLLKMIDELCDEGILNGENVLFQCVDDYNPRNYKKFTLISDKEFKEIISDSDVIISHAGTGSVTSTLKLHKKMILFPRMSHYGEHGDDHQLDLCDLFESKGFVMVAKNKNELRKCIMNVDSFIPKTFESNNKKINEIIFDYLSNEKSNSSLI